MRNHRPRAGAAYGAGDGHREQRMTWAIYARVSSEEQAADSLSIDAQLRALRDWAAQRKHDVQEFVDAGKSAWTEDIDKRPAFKAMLSQVRARAFEGVAVTHLDRFSRKLIVTLQAFGILGQNGTRFVCLESATLDFSSPMGALVLQVLGGFAEYYSSELSRKIKRGLVERASRGLHVGTLPFGYCNGRCLDCKANKTCSRWATLTKDMPAILHPDDWPGVRLAYETFKTGAYTDEQIANSLNEKGFRSRTRKGRELWNRFSIQWVLTNLSYTGSVMVNEVEHAGHHPAIISRELFDEVQALRRSRYKQSRTFSPKYRTYLFSGIMTCIGCGQKMRAGAYSSNDRRGYRCMSHESKKVVCTKPHSYIPAEPLEDQFGDIIKAFVLPTDWRERVKQIVAENSGRHDVEGERRKLSDRLARLHVMFEMGGKSEAEYREEVNRLKAQLAALKPHGEHEVIDAGVYLEKMAAVWDAATLAERREMVMTMLYEIVCDPAARQVVAFKPKMAFVPLFRQCSTLTVDGGVFRVITD